MSAPITFAQIDEATRARLMRQLAERLKPLLITAPVRELPDLYDALSLLLAGEESHHARYTAFAIRQAEEAQQTFLTML